MANTIPREILTEVVLNQRKEEKQIQQQFVGAERLDEISRLRKRYFGNFDTWLDRCTHGIPWLREDQIAQIVVDEIRSLDNVRYNLLAYCVMPNHVHLLIDTTEFAKVNSSNESGMTREYLLSDTLRLLKGRTARHCNQALALTGAFWHHESYDHVVRDDGELERIIRYILGNPVKAGLVNDAKEWKFTYISPEMGEW